mgnify:CR=1 FL=1
MFNYLKRISAVLNIFARKVSRWLLVASCWLFFVFPVNADVLTLPTVTVMADHSLSMAVSEIARNYSRDKKTIVNTSFVPQKIQQEQINEGAAADILITSKDEWIDELKLQGLIDIHSQTKFAKDRLVLIASVESNIVSQGAGRFPTVEIIKSASGTPIFMLGNPESLMEGVYAKEAMRSLGASDDLEPYTLYVKRLDEMLDMVVKQQAFGVCFYSSVFNRSDLKIIDMIPESAHKPIVYYAAVVASDNMDEARNFLAYLKSTEVRKLLSKYGFVID